MLATLGYFSKNIRFHEGVTAKGFVCYSHSWSKKEGGGNQMKVLGLGSRTSRIQGLGCRVQGLVFRA